MTEVCLCNIVLEIGNPREISFFIEDVQQEILELGDAVIISGTAPIYEGSYYVRPILYNQQTLETNGMLMEDDVVIDSITVTETTNPHGGTTVVIG